MFYYLQKKISIEIINKPKLLLLQFCEMDSLVIFTKFPSHYFQNPPMTFLNLL